MIRFRADILLKDGHDPVRFDGGLQRLVLRRGD
jgi:hypothetical protein